MKPNQRSIWRRMPVFTGILISLLTAGTLNAADWPEWRGNQKRTAYYADPAGLPDQKPLWTASLGCPLVSSPSVVGTILYIGGRDSCVHAIDTRNGRELWKKQTGGWVDASPLVHKGMVIVGSRDGTVYVLNALTGTQVSEFKAGLQLSSAALTAEGTVLAGAGPPLNGLTAYSFQQGPLSKLSKAGNSWFVPFNQITYSSPAVMGSRAVIGVSDGRLVAINLLTKDTAWCARTGGGVYLSTPAIDDSTVYFAPGNVDRSVYAFDVATGVFFWTNLGKKAAPAKTAATNMISPSQFRDLLRLSPADRESAAKAYNEKGLTVPPLLLRKPMAKTAAASQGPAEDFVSYGETKTSSVAVDKEHVYVIQKELGYPAPRFSLIAVGKYNGEEKWHFSDVRASVKLGYCSSPVTTGNVVFCGWGGGRVYGLVAKTGEIAWQDSLQGDVVASPAIANGRLYFATMEGNIYSYALGNTLPGRNFKQSTYCYPNPARDSSMIQVFVAKKARMDLAIYTISEKPVFKMSADLPAMEPSSPKFTYRWDIRHVANGVYFAIVKVRYEDGSRDKKILKIAVLK